MMEVVLHIYDVTKAASGKKNNFITQLNKIMKDGIGLGGIFHGAIEVYSEEWSFGFCENGTGVYRCPPKQNPMYTYRESIALGKTTFSVNAVTQILARLSRKWPGYSYDLLSRNCNHFCDKFCEELGVQRLPAWVNRFANAGVAVVEFAKSTSVRFRQAETYIRSASKVAYRFVVGGISNSSVEGQGFIQGSGSGNGGLQFSWFKNIVSFKSSGTSQDPNAGDRVKDQRSKNSNCFFGMVNSFADPARRRCWLLRLW